jgi:hypothetical protein
VQLLLESLSGGHGLLPLRLRLCQRLHGGCVALLPLLGLGLRGVLLLLELLLPLPGLGEFLLRLGQRLLGTLEKLGSRDGRRCWNDIHKPFVQPWEALELRFHHLHGVLR